MVESYGVNTTPEFKHKMETKIALEQSSLELSGQEVKDFDTFKKNAPPQAHSQFNTCERQPMKSSQTEHKRFDRPLLETASRHSGPQKVEIKGLGSSIHECLSSNTEE
jgi:hypothetical protein